MILSKIRGRFSKGGAARNVLILTIGTSVAQLVSIAIMPILSRIYSPSDFGILAVFLAVSGICATLVTFRYETSILVPKHDSEASNLVILSLLLAVFLSFFIGGLSTLINDTVLNFLGLSVLNDWLILAVILSMPIATLSIIQGWLNRKRKYIQMSILRITQSFATAGLAIVFGLNFFESGLLFAQVISVIISSLIAFWFGREVFKFYNKFEIKKAACIHKNAPKFILPTSMLDVITLQMPLILIALWYGQDLAGQFSMAWRLLMLPMTLVGGAIGQVFLEKLAKDINNIDKSKMLLKNTWKYLFLLSFVPLAVVMLLGDYIFVFFLGSNWESSGVIAKILAPMVLVMFISSPTSGTFIILGIQKYSPIFGFSSLIYRPLSLYIGYYLNDIYIGLALWAFCEVVQICLYQRVAWSELSSRTSLNVIKG